MEKRWFGADPRGRLERPNDIPEESCVRLSLLTGALLLAIALGGGWAAGLPTGRPKGPGKCSRRWN